MVSHADVHTSPGPGREVAARGGGLGPVASFQRRVWEQRAGELGLLSREGRDARGQSCTLPTAAALWPGSFGQFCVLRKWLGQLKTKTTWNSSSAVQK